MEKFVQREKSRYSKAMQSDDVFKKLHALRPFIQNEMRAPHKPLLLLWAFGRIKGFHNRLALYDKEVKNPLSELLEKFNNSEHIHPEQPFWRLQKDGLWEVEGAESVTTDRGGNPSIKDLNNKRGGLPEPLYNLLNDDPGFLRTCAQLLLDWHFRETQHDDIRDAVGLPSLQMVREEKSGRDGSFRIEVLRAYEERCAICDFDLRIRGKLFGLEAAHIRSHGIHGPNEVSNGLALCSIHHKAFDYGAMGLKAKNNDYVILVSDRVKSESNSSTALQQLVSCNGKLLRPPLENSLKPDQKYVVWHRKHLFYGAPLDSDQA